MASNMTEAQAVQWSTFTTDNNLSLDSFIVFQDVDKTHSDMIDRYYDLKNKSFTTDAEKAEMTQLAIDLIEYLPTSDTWNKLCACIMTMQMYMRDGIVVFVNQKQQEINEIVSNYSEKGIWNATTVYKTGNFVKHGDYLFLSKVDNNLNHEPNNEVLVDDYWMRFLIKGDKGDPSLNISIKKGTDGVSSDYDALQTYNVGDACVYNHRLYYCLVDGTIGINPTDITKWKCADKIWVGIDEPLDTTVIWWDINVGENVLKRYSVNNEWVRQNVKASDITIVDSGNLYASTNVESALSEVMTKVNTIDLIASKVSVVDSGNLYTGTNAETCFAEVMTKANTAISQANSAFTSANNGKTSIASVVGTITSSNTFTEIANEIQADKNILATNLTNKGVSASGTSTLKSLSNAVNSITIQSMGGRTPVSGTTTISISQSSRFYINLEGKINFTPIAVFGTVTNEYGSYSFSRANTNFCYDKYKSSYISVNSSEIPIKGACLGEGDSSHQWSAGSYTVNWTAI